MKGCDGQSGMILNHIEACFFSTSSVMSFGIGYGIFNGSPQIFPGDVLKGD